MNQHLEKIEKYRNAMFFLEASEASVIFPAGKLEQKLHVHMRHVRVSDPWKSWLVGGWVTPLKNIEKYERQLGWWHSQY